MWVYTAIQQNTWAYKALFFGILGSCVITACIERRYRRYTDIAQNAASDFPSIIFSTRCLAYEKACNKFQLLKELSLITPRLSGYAIIPLLHGRILKLVAIFILTHIKCNFTALTHYVIWISQVIFQDF